ncbi:MAG: hypothetical protein IJE10_03285 [Clostridia bacterium]|nr:hypothetical protein [Clostridia bacterium]
MRNNKFCLSIREMVLFSMLAGLMFCSRVVLAPLANIHLVGVLTMTYTVAFRSKALVPIYLYIFLEGLFGGFSAWWLPYLYVWTVLWGATMLLPPNIRPQFARVVYPLICALHGFLFGILYAPAQALLFGLSFEEMVAWVIAGLRMDITHGIGNLVLGTLVLPLSVYLKKMQTQR